MPDLFWLPAKFLAFGRFDSQFDAIAPGCKSGWLGIGRVKCKVEMDVLPRGTTLWPPGVPK
jgi:hypothetical protein